MPEFGTEQYGCLFRRESRLDVGMRLTVSANDKSVFIREVSGSDATDYVPALQ